MAEIKGKLMCLNICSFGINHTGVPVAAVFAYKCPFLNISVVDLDPEKVISWNTKQIKLREKGLEDILRKCQNRNLIFTTDTANVVRLADIIFICLDTPPDEHSSLGDIEKAVKLIAEVCDSGKTIVLKGTTSVGTSEAVRQILQSSKRNLNFQVLTIPMFLSMGNATEYLLKPDKILIGSDLSKEGLEAAETLVVLYSQWVPHSRILTMKNRSAEISKISQNAFLAQRISNLSALSIICDTVGEGHIGKITEIMKGFKDIGSKYLEPSFGFGGPHLKNDIKRLVYMCEKLNLKEPAEYWKEVLLLNDYHKNKFRKKIMSTFFNSLSCERISVWGVGFKKDAEFVDDSLGIELCLSLLVEGASINVFDTMDKNQVMDELFNSAKKQGLDAEVLLKELTYCTDPYKAAYKAGAIVVCNDMEEFGEVDFNAIYKEMTKPPYVFDGRMCLPHEKLKEIGFVIKIIG